MGAQGPSGQLATDQETDHHQRHRCDVREPLRFGARDQVEAARTDGDAEQQQERHPWQRRASPDGVGQEPEEQDESQRHQDLRQAAMKVAHRQETDRRVRLREQPHHSPNG